MKTCFWFGCGCGGAGGVTLSGGGGGGVRIGGTTGVAPAFDAEGLPAGAVRFGGGSCFCNAAAALPDGCEGGAAGGLLAPGAASSTVTWRDGQRRRSARTASARNTPLGKRC